MDLDRHEVTVQGKDVPLTAKEFGLLEHLLRHPGRVLTHAMLLSAQRGYAGQAAALRERLLRAAPGGEP